LNKTTDTSQLKKKGPTAPGPNTGLLMDTRATCHCTVNSRKVPCAV
jgi:hypothetical protein